MISLFMHSKFNMSRKKNKIAVLEHMQFLNYLNRAVILFFFERRKMLCSTNKRYHRQLKDHKCNSQFEQNYPPVQICKSKTVANIGYNKGIRNCYTIPIALIYVV